MAGCLVDWDQYEPGGASAGAGGATGATSGAQTTGAATGSTTSQTGSTSSQGGSGGGGGGEPTACGTVVNASDDFEDGFPGAFYETQGPGATLSELGGETVIVLPSMQASWSGLSSHYAYDLRERYVQIEVAQSVDPTSTAEMFLNLGASPGSYVAISQRAGQLIASRSLDGQWSQIAAVPYVPAQHRFWRLSESAGTLHWQASPDGQAMTDLATLPLAMLFPVDLVYVEIGASTSGSEASPGEAHFADLAGGPSGPFAWCASTDLTDDFEDATLAAAWSASYDGGGCDLSEALGVARIDFQGGPPSDCALLAAQPRDLVGSAIFLEVPAIPTGVASHYTYFRMEIDSQNGVEFLYYGGDLIARYEVAGVMTDIAQVPYAAAEHRWLRMREQAGAIHWDTAPDGAAWTSWGSTASPVDASALRPVIGAGMASNEPGGAFVEFDNVNVVPP